MIASCRPTAELFVRIERRKTPYVLIDRRVPGASANYVGVDDVAVGQLATEHLIAIGCKRIAHIRGPETSPGVARLEGYKRALIRGGFRIDDRYITAVRKVDVDSKRTGAEAMAQLLRLKPQPDGVFCYNDPLATGAMGYALYTERGFRQTWRLSGVATCTMTIRCGSACPASINTADGSAKPPRALRWEFSARACRLPLKR